MTRGHEQRYVLHLFVNGASELSGHAVTHAHALCEAHLANRYELTVSDIHEDLAAVARERVIAAPTLVRLQPAPSRRFVGDLAHGDRVAATLDLPPLPEATTGPV